LLQCRKRKLLYERIAEYLPIALQQASDYAPMGALISKKYIKRLVLGADNDIFAAFYSFIIKIPTLYLKRNYC